MNNTPENDDIVLDTCPCCGGSASFWTQGGRYGFWAYVQCDTCGLRTKGVKTDVPANEPDFFDMNAPRILASLWNRRVSNKHSG